MQITIPTGMQTVDVATSEDLDALAQSIQSASSNNNQQSSGPSGTISLLRKRDLGNTANSEMVTQLNITTGQPYSFHRIFQVHADNVKAGDSFVVNGLFQATTEQTYNLMMASAITVNLSATDSFGTRLGEIGRAGGTNFDRAIHHLPVLKAGKFVATQDYDDLYFTMWGYAASTAASSGDKVNIDQNYGRMFVDHYYYEDVDLSTL